MELIVLGHELADAIPAGFKGVLAQITEAESRDGVRFAVATKTGSYVCPVCEHPGQMTKGIAH